MREEIVETDLDYVLDLVEDFELHPADRIADLIEALQEEEAAFESCDSDEDEDEDEEDDDDDSAA